MNLHDSEHVAGVLERAGYSPAADIDSAAVIVFNTCSVRKSAEERVWGNLGRLFSPGKGLPVVAVCGCMAVRVGEQISSSGRARVVFSMDTLESLPELIERAAAGPVLATGDVTCASIDCLPSLRRSALRAWVPVSHGCDNYCSYCVVPYVRGGQRSRPSGEVLDEVRALADDGVVEVTLLGQNVNSYGRDNCDVDFAAMLDSVASVPGIDRVKFESSHPRDLDDSILRAMGQNVAVCEHLHLSVQSGSDRVLKAMNRGYDAGYYMERVQAAREAVEGLVVTTDIIVGFPGEDERDFEATLELVRRARFDAAYTFIYSEREGTTAANMREFVPGDVKHERFGELCALQEENTRLSLASMVSREVEVLIEGPARRGDMLSGRTRGGRVVLLAGGSLEGEALVKARITGSGKHAARGIIEEVLRRPRSLS